MCGSTTVNDVPTKLAANRDLCSQPTSTRTTAHGSAAGGCHLMEPLLPLGSSRTTPTSASYKPIDAVRSFIAPAVAIAGRRGGPRRPSRFGGLAGLAGFAGLLALGISSFQGIGETTALERRLSELPLTMTSSLSARMPPNSTRSEGAFAPPSRTAPPDGPRWYSTASSRQSA